jgi:hypothetical protein
VGSWGLGGSGLHPCACTTPTTVDPKMASLLESFDPFATHPFTNGCGVLPQPPPPSLYAVPIPSSHSKPIGLSKYPDLSTFASTTPSSSPTQSLNATAPLLSPQPQRPSLSSSATPSSPPGRQIFVPFRKDTSSPDLVLKKKTGRRSTDSTARAK